MPFDTHLWIWIHISPFFFSFSCALSSVFITWNITLHELFIWNRKGNMDRSYGRAPGGGESGAAAVFFFSPAHASSCLFCLLVCRKCTPAAGGMRKIRKRREKKAALRLCVMWAVVMDGMVCVCAGYLSVYDIFTITWWKGNSIKAFFARSLFLVVCMRDSQLFNYSHIRQVCLFFYITLSPALSLSLAHKY